MTNRAHSPPVDSGHKGDGDQDWSYLKPEQGAPDGMSLTVRTRTLSWWS
jgi:hypothetical protein